jgi:hypothetical protein
LNSSLPSAICVGEATSRSSVMVRPSVSRTNAWLIDASAANSSVIHSSAASTSVRSGSGPAANVTAVRLVTANNKAALSP